MQIKCIIAEDEPLGMERARQYVHRVPFLDLVATFENSMDTLVYLREHSVDLLFLDINMGEFSGIQLLESLNVSAAVVLITASHEHAIKGFDLNVTDYLLKPYTFERFMQAVNKVQHSFHNGDKEPVNDFIFVKTEHRLEKIWLNDILFIEGMRDYRKIHTLQKKIMTLKTFGEFEHELPQERICRIHKSYMISISKIQSIQKDAVRIGDQLIPVSETYRKSFMERINK